MSLSIKERYNEEIIPALMEHVQDGKTEDVRIVFNFDS